MAMAVSRSNTDGIAQCGMSRATPEATGRHHQATTHSVLPQRPPGQQQMKRRQKNVPKRLAILMAAGAGTIPRASPNRGGPGLHEKPLDATIGQALAPTNINRTYLRRFLFSLFIINLYKKVAG